MPLVRTKGGAVGVLLPYGSTLLPRGQRILAPLPPKATHSPLTSFISAFNDSSHSRVLDLPLVIGFTDVGDSKRIGLGQYVG